MSEPCLSALRVARAGRTAPSTPTPKNTTASVRCQCRTRPNNLEVLSYQSRPHCQLKYWNHIPICAPSDACRSHTGRLPYCWRVSTSHSVLHVVGSPSLMGG